jgi:ABC-type transporter Mla MlaB component
VIAVDTVRLAGCCLRDIARLRAELLRHWDADGNVIVSAEGVAQCDTAVLQLLSAFARDLRASGRTLEWHGDVATIAHAARLLGLADVLALPRQVGAGVES